MKPKIIVCGLGRTGYNIFGLLRQQGAAVVGISDCPISGEPNEAIVVGDLRSPATLVNAGIKHAHTLVLASDDDAINLGILTQARLINPRIRIVNRLFNQTLGERLDTVLPAHVSMSVSALAAPIFSFAALGSKAIGQLELYNKIWPIQEIVIDPHCPWQGLKLSDLWDDPSRMLIYYLPKEGEIDLVSAVDQGKVLEKGDRIIVGIKPTLRAKRRSFWQKLLEAIANLHQYRRYANSLAIVTLSLLSVIFVATLLYVSVNYGTPVVDALYFSVGMITGAGGEEDVVEKAPSSIKIFTILMMIVGAGVVGIYYALLNDFILGSRLKQFWDAARVPKHNHYILCGMGAIGIQIVRQLQSQGHEVVIIESDDNNRFLHTARSLGVPIILEDARLEATLKAANIDRAEAIIVVTSDDLVNVEIALTAKAVAPRISVVVRAQDSQFARSIQEIFEFDNVLCPTELAAPSFAAAALGGRILGNGMTDDLLWVAIATLITSNHPFCGKIVKESAMDSNFVPLYIERKGYLIHSWEILEARLMAGDVLYLTMPANRLEQLWRTNDSEIVVS
jgi:Trk K+ transport system NAD-binding subunit